jgi:hypothetical protein
VGSEIALINFIMIVNINSCDCFNYCWCQLAIGLYNQIWPPRAILVSDWLMLKKSSPLKLLGQMEPDLAGSIYARSSIKLLQYIT